jgi:acetyltransferase-like isoleucine patch superfamily enzyme
MINYLKKTVRFFYTKFKYAKFVKFDSSVLIGKGSTFLGMNKLHSNSNFKGQLGLGSYIGPRTHFSGEIGNFSSIGPDVKVISGTHPYKHPFVSTSPAFYSLRKQNGSTLTKTQRFDETLMLDKEQGITVSIGHDCWLGDRVLVIGGVSIGNGAMILAGSIVTKNIPPFAIVGGVPAKIIKYRFDQSTIDFLETFKWWDNDVYWLKNNIELMNNMDKLKNEFS